MNSTVQRVDDTKFLKVTIVITPQDNKVGDRIFVPASNKEGKLLAAKVGVSAMKGMHAGNMSRMDMSGAKVQLQSLDLAPWLVISQRSQLC